MVEDLLLPGDGRSNRQDIAPRLKNLLSSQATLDGGTLIKVHAGDCVAQRYRKL